MNLKRWLPVLIVAPILAGAVLALVLVLANNAAQKTRAAEAEKEKTIARATDKFNELIDSVRLSDDERAMAKKNGTSERGWERTARMVMDKNPMSIKAFRAARPPIAAFQIFVRIENITDWGDWSDKADQILAFSLHEYDGTDAGLAVIAKESDEGKALFDVAKDGKKHPVIALMMFRETRSDPVILFFADP